MVLTKRDNACEWLPVVDEAGNILDRATRADCHGGSMKLHPVVHLHVFDASGRLYLQKRPEWKDIQPGKWDTAVGGHIDFGEGVNDALVREAREELGLDGFDYEPLGCYVFESECERELVNAYRAIVDADAPKPSDELDGGRFWILEEISSNLQIMTPNLVHELRKFNFI